MNADEYSTNKKTSNLNFWIGLFYYNYDHNYAHMDKHGFESFAELESQTVDGIVPHDRLKESLVASTYFFVGDAVAIIEDMLKHHKLEMIESGQYRRVNTLTNAPTSETDVSSCYKNKELAKLLSLHILYGNGDWNNETMEIVGLVDGNNTKKMV
jgi:hypothetical protein